MKLLLDENPSRRLIAAIEPFCPQSVHVGGVGLARADDEAIWRYAFENEYCIVTHDMDFLERTLIRGTPPPVIRLTVGNTSTRHIREILLRHLSSILERAKTDPPPHVWEVT